MKVLFIGGTGVISSACSPLAIERGFELYLLNRGQTDRVIPEGAHVLQGDIRDPDSVKQALAGHEFDVVVNWIAYTPEHVEADINLFRNRTGQYVFISSASAYQSPPVNFPVTESTPLDNPYWGYSQAKIACEDKLMAAYREEKFPITLVRPSHTYDCTKIPLTGGYTSIARMRQGKKVVIHGDGASFWVMTHHADFAKGFVGLLGNSRAIGESFHITSDEVLTWNQITEILARAAGTEADIIHIPSDLLNAYDEAWGASLLGDKANSMVFDNSKIKRVVPDFAATIPFARGAEEMMAWVDADPARQVVDARWDGLMDKVIAAYEKAWPT